MNREEAMSDYVWDGSGPPEEDVARLEALLAGQRHSGKAPKLEEAARGLSGLDGGEREDRGIDGPRVGGTVVFGRRWMAVAAGVGLVLMAAWLARVGRGGGGPSFALDEIRGSPRVASAVAVDSARLGVGQWLQTDGSSSARIEVADIGHVTVRPNSRVQLKSTGVDRHVLELARGRIEATITAPPRVFLVDTPSARAVDMGCQYVLDVSQDGSGLLRVTLGHVLLEGDGREADVVMFASCRTRRGAGPGTPYFDDASPEFIGELEKFDFDGGGGKSLAVVVKEARGKDALSLFHLFKRLTGAEKEVVFEKLAALKPLPASVRKEDVFEGDEGALTRWWEDMRPF